MEYPDIRGAVPLLIKSQEPPNDIHYLNLQPVVPNDLSRPLRQDKKPGILGIWNVNGRPAERPDLPIARLVMTHLLADLYQQMYPPMLQSNTI